MMRVRVGMLLLLGVLAVSAPVQADTIVLTATDSGYFNQVGNTIPISNNYFVGYAGCDGGCVEFRNFFVFDLSSLAGMTITAASLRLPTRVVLIAGSPVETYTLFDVTTPIANLSTNSVATYADLGTGTSFGLANYTSADYLSTRTIGLNGSGVAAVQAAVGSFFALGGRLTTLDTPLDQYLFAGSQNVIERELIVEVAPTAVPEPTTLTLLALGVAGIARRRHQV